MVDITKQVGIKIATQVVNCEACQNNSQINMYVDFRKTFTVGFCIVHAIADFG